MAQTGVPISQDGVAVHPDCLCICLCYLHFAPENPEDGEQWELLYADDLAVIAETEDDLIKRLNEWKDFMENRGMRINMNKTKVMISGEWQKVMQKAVRWLFGVCGKNSIQCTSCQKRVHRKCSGIKGCMYKVMKTFI